MLPAPEPVSSMACIPSAHSPKDCTVTDPLAGDHVKSWKFVVATCPVKGIRYNEKIYCYISRLHHLENSSFSGNTNCTKQVEIYIIYQGLEVSL